MAATVSEKVASRPLYYNACKYAKARPQSAGTVRYATLARDQSCGVPVHSSAHAAGLTRESERPLRVRPQCYRRLDPQRAPHGHDARRNPDRDHDRSAECDEAGLVRRGQFATVAD